MADRVALVTGGTDGIGRAVALRLASAGDRVLIVGRNEERGRRVLAELNSINGKADHAFVPADLSLLGQTATMADEVLRRTDRLDAVVCCAGILSTVPEWTSEGLERNLVLNYLTRFLLAQKLLPTLTESPSGRLVLVANAGKYADTLDLDDLQHRNGKPGMQVSGRTQFANDLLAVELAERVHGTSVEVTCVFPGVTKSSVVRNARGLPTVLRAVGTVMNRLIGHSTEAAAVTPAYLATDSQAIKTNGRFYGPAIKELKIPERASRPDRRSALWSASEGLVAPYRHSISE